MSILAEVFSKTASKLALFFFLNIAVISWCFAEEQLRTHDGRDVVIYGDGTWEFASTDKYATTADGRYVQLKGDGSWSYVDDTPVVITHQYANAINVGSQSQGASTSLVSVQLEEAFVEQFSEKAGAQSKNVRTHSYINVLLNVALPDSAQQPILLDELGPEDVLVKDGKNVRYDVLSLEYDLDELKPGDSSQLKIITDGAPNRMFGSKELFVKIQSTEKGIPYPVEVELNYRGLNKVNITKKY